MNITCPRCGFSRELPADRLPSKAVIATCPHCACRFRLVPGVGVMDVLSEPEHPIENPAHNGDSQVAAARPEKLGAEPHGRGAWQSGDDDPLPPGAIVPGHSVQKPSYSDDERDANREPAQKPQSGRKFPQADAGEEKHIGNLWGLLGGKNIFGQRDDKSSEKRAGERDDDNQQKRNSQRGLFGPADDDADESRNASAF